MVCRTEAAREGVDITRYDALVMDTQGSELPVLKGAQSLLPGFARPRCRFSRRTKAARRSHRGGGQRLRERADRRGV